MIICVSEIQQQLTNINITKITITKYLVGFCIFTAIHR